MSLSKSDQLENMLLRDIPAHRWFLISQRMDQRVEDIMQSTLAMLVVAANERHRAETGKDDFARFLNMGFLDLVDASGVNEIDDPADEDGDESGGDDDDPKSDVLEGPGEVLPDHGPYAD